MHALRVALPLTLAGALASSCGDGAQEVAAAAEAAAASDQTDARPVSNYKDERKRAALSGLDYDSGLVVIVPGEAALRVDGPDAAEAERQFAEGVQHLARNARLEAISAHTLAVLLAPDSPRMYAGLGDALIAKRMIHRAEAAYRTALQHEPDSAELHFKLADTIWRIDKKDEALAEVREAIRLQPDHAKAHERLAIWSYYTHDYAGAWQEVHRAEALGETLPPQFRVLLAEHMTEPAE